MSSEIDDENDDGDDGNIPIINYSISNFSEFNLYVVHFGAF